MSKNKCDEKRERPCDDGLFPFKLCFGNWQNLATIVFATFKTNVVGPLHLAALGTFHQVKCFNRVMRPPTIAA